MADGNIIPLRREPTFRAIETCKGDGRACYVRSDGGHHRCGTSACGDDYLAGRDPRALVRPHPMAPAGLHDFAPRPSFRPAETLGAVYWGRVRLSPETATAILADLQRDALRFGDWGLFDQLSAARDGIEPEPPTAA